VFKGQIDTSAAMIRGFERLGWAHSVRWPKRERLVARLHDPALASRLRDL
jgi:stearoyl-CoA desaturase (Delta-9 desaturase)